MITTLEDFYEEVKPLVSSFALFMEKYGLKDIAKPDHLCYKCVSQEEYEQMKPLFDFESDYVYQSIISERRIAIVRLKKSIDTPFGPLGFLELSDQKKDGSQKSGFDHIEIYPVKGTYLELIQKIENQGAEIKKVVRPHHTTHDIEIESGFLIRLEEEPLEDKIKREEMK